MNRHTESQDNQRRDELIARIRLLHEEGASTRLVSPCRALDIFSQALELAESADLARERAWSTLHLAECRTVLAEFAPALADAERACRLFEALGDEHGLAQALRWAASNRYRLEDDVAAREMAFRALELARKNDLPQVAADALNVLGRIYASVANYPCAIEVLLDARTISEQAGYERGAAATAYHLGYTYHQLCDWSKAYELKMESLQRFLSIGDRVAEAVMLGEIGHTVRMSEGADAALDYYERSIALYRSLGAHVFEGWVRLNIALLYAERGMKERAAEHQARAEELMIASGERRGCAYARRCAGVIAMGEGRHGDALLRVEESLAIAREVHDQQLECELHELLTRIHETSGDYRKALEFYRHHVHLKNEIDDQQKRRRIAEMHTRVDVERAERRTESYRREVTELGEKMERKSKELTTMALHLAQKSEFLTREVVPVLEEQGDAGEGMVGALLRKIQSDTRDIDWWRKFEEHFQQIHEGFRLSMSERCPMLTPAELRICAMLRINLSSKEIASLLGASVHTIDTHRRKIRRKLGLPNQANLASFLASLREY